jgi:hypothetical protein
MKKKIALITIIALIIISLSFSILYNLYDNQVGQELSIFRKISVIASFILFAIVNFYFLSFLSRPYTLKSLSRLRKWDVSVLAGTLQGFAINALFYNSIPNANQNNSVNILLTCIIPSILISIIAMIGIMRLSIETNLQNYYRIDKEIKTKKESNSLKMSRIISKYLGKELFGFYRHGY